MLNYGIGNLRSVANALSFLRVDFPVTSTSKEIRQADKLILPRLDAFPAGMRNLENFDFISVSRRG